MSTRSIANAVGGRTARACDGCVRKRARWYCAADDAFLCQSCDSTVHSANLLARRHHRLRLNSSTSKSPTWLSSLTRKPRTPRPRPPKYIDPVPDTADEATSLHDNELDDHLLFEVPTFYPFDLHQNQSKSDWDLDGSFAADVESLLGRNLESELFDMEGLGVSLDKEFDTPNNRVKVEEGHENYYQLGVDDDCRLQHEPLETDDHVDLMREHFEFDFEHEEEMITMVDVKNERQENCEGEEDESMNNNNKNNTKVGLRLDCDAVIATWGNDKCPWTTGERPHLDFHDSWPHCMAICGVSYRHMCCEHGDNEREARLLRYKEKRRTRLFSRKIRYEVRKLNAEKRPRMKGRFVKRMPFTQSTLPIVSIL